MLGKIRKLLQGVPCDDDDNNTENSDDDNEDGSSFIDWSIPGIVIGNRNYKIFSSRGITRIGFQTCVRILTMNKLRIQDSQCGYKLMTLNASKKIYKNLHLQGWVSYSSCLFYVYCNWTKDQLVPRGEYKHKLSIFQSEFYGTLLRYECLSTAIF